jgi:hypothetical protein
VIDLGLSQPRGVERRSIRFLLDPPIRIGRSRPCAACWAAASGSGDFALAAMAVGGDVDTVMPLARWR